MRIPGVDRVSSRLIATFAVTESDLRVLSRGVRDVKSTAVGAGSAYIASGGDFIRDPKGAAVFVVSSAAAAMAGKKSREQVNTALYTPAPPKGTK